MDKNQNSKVRLNCTHHNGLEQSCVARCKTHFEGSLHMVYWLVTICTTGLTTQHCNRQMHHAGTTVQYWYHMVQLPPGKTATSGKYSIIIIFLLCICILYNTKYVIYYHVQCLLFSNQEQNTPDACALSGFFFFSIFSHHHTITSHDICRHHLLSCIYIPHAT